MATTVKFDINRQFDRDVQPLLVDDLDRAAKQLATDASMVARVQAYGAGERGHYADSIQGFARMEAGEAVGQVVARKFTAHWLEHGTRFMAPRRILGTAARKSGYRMGRGRNSRR